MECFYLSKIGYEEQEKRQGHQQLMTNGSLGSPVAYVMLQPWRGNEGAGTVESSRAYDTCYAEMLVKGEKKRCWECGEQLGQWICYTGNLRGERGLM